MYTQNIKEIIEINLILAIPDVGYHTDVTYNIVCYDTRYCNILYCTSNVLYYISHTISGRTISDIAPWGGQIVCASFEDSCSESLLHPASAPTATRFNWQQPCPGLPSRPALPGLSRHCFRFTGQTGQTGAIYCKLRLCVPLQIVENSDYRRKEITPQWSRLEQSTHLQVISTCRWLLCLKFYLSRWNKLIVKDILNNRESLWI